MNWIKDYNKVALLQVGLFGLSNTVKHIDDDLFYYVYTFVLMFCFALINFHLYKITPFHKVGTKFSSMLAAVMYSYNVIEVYFIGEGLTFSGISSSLVFCGIAFFSLLFSSDLDIDHDESDKIDDDGFIYLVFKKPSNLLHVIVAFTGVGNVASLSIYSDGYLYKFKKRDGKIHKLGRSKEVLENSNYIIKKVLIKNKDYQKYYDTIKDRTWEWKNFNCLTAYMELFDNNGILVHTINPAKFLNTLEDYNKIKYKK